MNIREDMENVNLGGLLKKSAAWIIPVVVGLPLVFGSFYTVNQTERGVLTRFGEIVGVTEPGLHFKLPIAEGVRHIDVSTDTITWARNGNNDSRMEAYSQDQQPADIAVTVTYHLPGSAESIRQIATQYGSRERLYEAVIVPSATEALKNIFGTYDAVRAIQHRAELNREVVGAVRAAVGQAPVVIDNVQIQDISFSDAYEQAVEARMQAQVEVQRQEQERDRARIQAEQVVITAQADAESRRLRGEAEASAIRARAAALATNPSLVQLTAAERWNGVLPETMVPGGAVPMLNLPRTGN